MARVTPVEAVVAWLLGVFALGVAVWMVAYIGWGPFNRDARRSSPIAVARKRDIAVLQAQIDELRKVIEAREAGVGGRDE